MSISLTKQYVFHVISPTLPHTKHLIEKQCREDALLKQVTSIGRGTKSKILTKVSHPEAVVTNST